ALTDPEAAAAYLTRLERLGGYFDALLARHRAAEADGRFPTTLGLRQAIEQVDDYLATDLDRDPLLRPQPTHADSDWARRARELVATTVRPALARYRDGLSELLRVGRDDDQVGICHVPGGREGYLAAT